MHTVFSLLRRSFPSVAYLGRYSRYCGLCPMVLGDRTHLGPIDDSFDCSIPNVTELSVRHPVRRCPSFHRPPQNASEIHTDHGMLRPAFIVAPTTPGPWTIPPHTSCILSFQCIINNLYIILNGPNNHTTISTCRINAFQKFKSCTWRLMNSNSF